MVSEIHCIGLAYLLCFLFTCDGTSFDSGDSFSSDLFFCPNELKRFNMELGFLNWKFIFFNDETLNISYLSKTKILFHTTITERISTCCVHKGFAPNLSSVLLPRTTTATYMFSPCSPFVLH